MPSAWLRGYKQASFRGVEFYIQSASNQGGRRLATHNFPERDDVAHEDLGRAERSFSFRAYIVADDYFQQREALIAALEQEGAGKLIHPYRGEFQVVCDSFTVTERTEDGRVAWFDLSFKEEKGRDLTVLSPNTQSQVFSAKENFLDSAQAWLEDVYTIVRKPTTYIEDATETIDAALDVVDSLKKIANVNAEFQKALSDARGKLVELTFSAEQLGQSFRSLLNFGTEIDPRDPLVATSSNAATQYQECIRLFDWGETPVVTTPTDIVTADDYPATLVQKFNQYNALAAAAGLSSVVDYDSAQDAQAVLEQLTELIDNVVLADAISDEMYEGLLALRAAVNEDLTARIITLPTLVDFTVKDTVSSLYVSNEIYGNLDEEQAIVDRNRIVHPGFITPAEPIQVKAIE